MKVSVAALGSCVSRDPFNTLFNPSYKDFFKMDAYQFQMSIISLMSNPIRYNSEDYVFEKKVSENSDWHFRTELNKRFLNDLVAVSPDYLIIDFYTDVLFGVIEVDDSYLSNKKEIFSKNKLWEKLHLGQSINVQEDFDIYFNLFKKSFDKFMLKKKKYLPNTKIVINKARFTNEYWDDVKKEIITFGNKNSGYYDILNHYWSELDNYVISTYNTEAIEYNKKYYADPNYRFGGLHTVHYKNNFYEDFQLKLLAIVFRDLTDNKLQLQRRRHYNGNLIQNGDFSLGSSSWKIFRPDIFRVNDCKLSVYHMGETDNQWNQIVSDPIENFNSKQVYRLEFKISFDKKVLHEFDSDDAIVKIRTFNSRNHFKAKDSIQEVNITKSELLRSLPAGKGKFKKKIELEGRFIKVIPYLRKNGSYELSNIWISRL